MRVKAMWRQVRCADTVAGDGLSMLAWGVLRSAGEGGPCSGDGKL